MTSQATAYGSISEVPPSTLTMEKALAAMDQLHPDSYARYTWNKLRHLLSAIMVGHHSPVFDDTPAKPMIRGRVHRPGPVGRYEHPKSIPLFCNLSELGCPPADRVNDYGRCHAPNAPVFYAAFDEDTVLAEIQPERESLVYFLTCRPKPGCMFRTRLIGEIDYIRRHGKSSIFSAGNEKTAEILEWIRAADSESDYVRLVTDAFFADLFSRRASSQSEYRASSALCSLFLGMDVDYPADGEALYYPSIAHRGGMNIALSASCYAEKVEPVSCKVVKVSAYFGHSIYKTQTLATSDKFGDDGKIEWVGVNASPAAPGENGC